MSGEGMIPEERFQKEVERRKAAEEGRKTLTEQVTELQSTLKAATKERDQFAAQVEGIADIRTELEETRASLATANYTNGAQVSMLEAGVAKSSVRDFMLFQHEQHKRAEGDKAKPWDEWWAASKDELLADFRPPAEATATEAEATSEPAPQRPQPQANNGAQPTPAPSQGYVPGSISGMSIDDFRANKERILADISNPWAT